MPNACKPCNHPQREALEKALLSGKRKRWTLWSKEFGLSLTSLHRHYERHTLGITRKQVRAAVRGEPPPVLPETSIYVPAPLSTRLILAENLTRGHSYLGKLADKSMIRVEAREPLSDEEARDMELARRVSVSMLQMGHDTIQAKVQVDQTQGTGETQVDRMIEFFLSND